MNRTRYQFERDQACTDRIARAWELVEGGFGGQPPQPDEQGMRPIEAAVMHLEAALELARARLPKGSVVATASPPASPPPEIPAGYRPRQVRNGVVFFLCAGCARRGMGEKAWKSEHSFYKSGNPSSKCGRRPTCKSCCSRERNEANARKRAAAVVVAGLETSVDQGRETTPVMADLSPWEMRRAAVLAAEGGIA